MCKVCLRLYSLQSEAKLSYSFIPFENEFRLYLRFPLRREKIIMQSFEYSIGEYSSFMVLNVVIVKGNKCDSFPVKWKLITHIKDLAKNKWRGDTQLIRVDLAISFVTSDSAIALVQLMKKRLAPGILNPSQRLCFQSNTGCKPIAGFRWKLQVQGVYKLGLGKERK